MNYNGSGGTTTLFVTVGSTKFHALIKAVLSKSVLNAISKAAADGQQGNVSMIVQFGATQIQEILFDDEHIFEGKDSGTLPIKILGGKGSIPQMSAEEIANNLRPDVIREQISSDDPNTEQRLGLKHFSLDLKASHGVVHLEFIDYVSSIRTYLEKADVVISHAGSGTILEALRLEDAIRPKLVVVPNETLMDNHQTELAKALSERHYVYAARLREGTHGSSEMCGKLPELLYMLLCKTSQIEKTAPLQNFPPFVPGRFCAIVDEEMGFVKP